jgi:hypothetical protein
MNDIIEILEPTYVKAQNDHVAIYHEIGKVVITAIVTMDGKQRITVERRPDK